MSGALLSIAMAADDRINRVHKAFGAPGDYGYESREGKALHDLYLFQVCLRRAIAAAESERPDDPTDASLSAPVSLNRT